MITYVNIVSMNKNIYIDTRIDNLIVSIVPKELNKNLLNTIEKKITKKYGNKCYNNVGYIMKNSIKLLSHNLIKVSGSTTTSLMTCTASIKCTVCRPYIDAIIKCYVINKIESAYLAYYGPLVIYIRRKDTDTEDLKIRQVINVEVKQMRFNEDSINIFAQFVSLSEELNYYELPQNSSDIVFVDTIKYTTDLQNYEYMEDAGHSIVVKTKKQEINSVSNWRFIRDLINPYELIFPSKYYNESIVDKTAFYESINALGDKSIKINNMINRAYFKIWEIIHDKKENKWGDVISNFNNQPITVLGMAEAPGGFLQAIIDSRLKNSQDKFTKDDIYRGISLKSEDIQWNTEVLDAYKNKFGLNFEYGYGTENGDLREVEEQLFIKESLLENKKAEIIFADGGMDVSEDYYSQEVQNHKLFYSEIIIALSNQAVGGVFIMKCYDLYTMLSIQYLTILKNYYDKVYIIKPDLSRPANSEKYIVALNYNGQFSKAQEKKSLDLLTRWDNEKYILELLTNVDNNIIGSMKFINDYFSGRQMEFIDNGLMVYGDGEGFKQKNNQLNYKEAQKQACLKWCANYEIPSKEIELRVITYR